MVAKNFKIETESAEESWKKERESCYEIGKGNEIWWENSASAWILIITGKGNVSTLW